MPYNWIYTNSNDNIYILMLLIIILGFIIIDFGLWKKKTDRFDDVQNDVTSIPQPTIYQKTEFENLMNSSFYITEEEETRRNAMSHLDGSEEALFNTTGLGSGTSTGLINFQNDITQNYSTLYNTSNSSVKPVNYATIGDYATLDSLGASLTDTLGGIKSDLGYTILDEQLGTFNSYSNGYNNNTYDNTANYKTGMNPSTVDGRAFGTISGRGSGNTFNNNLSQDNRPLFLQKDFQGVANIFAPNIIISNPPLMDDGIPDISFEM
jgi:hypothetical protein